MKKCLDFSNDPYAHYFTVYDVYENESEYAQYNHAYEDEPIKVDGKLFVFVDRLIIEIGDNSEIENMIDNGDYTNLDIARHFADIYNDGFKIDFVSGDLEYDPVIEEA